MPDFREQLRRSLQGRVGLEGVGNPDQGDDGFGVRLAEALSQPAACRPRGAGNPESAAWPNDANTAGGFRFSRCGSASVIIAGNAPERLLGRLSDGSLDTVLFLDAAEFGAVPGSVVLLNSQGITARFPQVSTHRVSLGVLAKWVEASGAAKAWLLGVQPASLKLGAGLTPPVQATFEILCQLLGELLAHDPRRPAETCLTV